MNTINFKTMIESLSEQSFDIAKQELAPFLLFYYCDSKNANKEMFLEKLCEFINRAGQNAKMSDEILANEYVNELLPFIEKRVEKGSQAEKYLDRAKLIQKKLKETSDKDCSLLEDFSKILLCSLSSALKKPRKKTSFVSFHMADVEFAAVKEAVFGEKQPIINMERARELANQFFQRNSDSAQNETENLCKDTGEKEEEEKHLVKIIQEDDDKLYSKKNAIRIILTLFYLQLSDFEGSF